MGNVSSLVDDASPLGGVEAAYAVQEAGLAGAVGTDDSGDIAPEQAGTDIVQALGPMIAEILPRSRRVLILFRACIPPKARERFSISMIFSLSNLAPCAACGPVDPRASCQPESPVSKGGSLQIEIRFPSSVSGVVDANI